MARTLFRVLSGIVVLTAAAGAGASDVEVIYSTRAGDTLIGLEKRFLTAPFGWKGMQSRNHISNPARMPVGSQLRIPEAWLRVEPRSARVLAVQGDVTVDGRRLAVDETLPGGSRLRTGDEAFVTLLMPDDSRLTVQPASLARLEKVQGFRGFEGQDTRVYLERGRVETTVTSQRGPAARYQVRTPTAVVGVRGTAFRVGSDSAAGTAQAEVTGGEVRMSPPGAGPATALPAGFGAVARAGAAIPAPRALLRAPQLDAMPSVMERVAMQFPFAAVKGAVRYRAQLARDEAFNDVVMDGVFDASPARFTGLADGDYWLRVRAIDDAGLEGYDAARAFALRARPEPPLSAVSTAARLSWQRVPEAAGYRVQVSRDTAFSDLAGEWDSTTPAVDTGLPPGAWFGEGTLLRHERYGDDVEALWAEESYAGALRNIDPDRERLYELCERTGVGIDAMKVYGGGDLLNAENSPFGKAMTPVPKAQSTAALFGCSRRRRFTMLKAKTVMAKKGIGSSAENTEPHHCQYSGVPIQK